MRAQKQSIFRFAPSPNGYLHLGHARSALLNQEIAAQTHGKLLLRMENLDELRCRTDYETAIMEDLAWLGVSWQLPVRRQSEHIDTYDAGLGQLRARGLLYPCFCSRQDVAKAVAGRANWPCDPDGSPLYPGTCRHLSLREQQARARDVVAPAYRLDIAQAIKLVPQRPEWHEYGPDGVLKTVAADPAQWGDVILARKDIPASYHLAVVLDDYLQGVTHVVRGQDLFAATSLHRLLQELFDYPAPDYFHHTLLYDVAGRKLAKSIGAKSLWQFRAEHYTKEDIIRMALA
ncbi:MAG: tRNA glutamyl-Q(34) synthetase GluQRS [Hyphomicrobiales bacterium]|nr:tRNA glutamyl-Q(34) synthetase GluQRS [Hyphomicrobiales bacterium]MDE2114363.1 tRNA glutamyl-Q(34) synthetase GluQRS [Hyphomicrobiales bacterium]